MPTMVNGIGTTYYGKKNLDHHLGVCKKCGYQGELKSYETRLWFVILLIPIIPLGKKQIIDYCPKCTHHKAVPLEEWQRLAEETIKEKETQMSANPGDPQSAINMHANLVAFNKRQEAGDMAKNMKSRFSGNFDVMMYLGTYYDEEGILGGASYTGEADDCFARALELDPANVDAKRAVAIGAIEKGDPHRARNLLSYMETPGPHQEYRILYMLASSFLAKKEHMYAYEIFKVISRDFPQLAKKDKDLRRDVQKTEKALEISQTALPKAPFNWRLAAAIAVVALLAAAYFIADNYFKNHLPLFLVNHFPLQATVSVPGGEPVTVASYQFREIAVPAGKHQVTVNVGDYPAEKTEIDIQYDFFEHLLDPKEVFILNVGGSAVILWEASVYSENPSPDSGYNFRFHLAKDFMTFKEIDYAFEEFPDTLEIESGSRVTKTRVGVFANLPASIVDILLQEKTPLPRIMDYVEIHLAKNPSDNSLLRKYVDLCHRARLLDRGAAFLSKNLSQRPLRMDWHRYYQEMRTASGKTKQLIAEYDAKLEKDPKDSDYLYFRGRIEPDGPESLRYFQRSLDANPENPYPWYGKGYYFAARGQFAQARDAIARANELKPGMDDWAEVLFGLRLALQEYDALESELDQRLKKEPSNFPTVNNMLQLLVARGNLEKARKIKTGYQQEIKKQFQQYPQLLKEVQDAVEMRWAYLNRDYPAYIKLAKTLPLESRKNISLFHGYIAQLKMKEAEQAAGAIEAEEIPGYGDLLLWLGWKVMLGSDEKAEKRLKIAIDKMRAGTPEQETIARLLEGRQSGVVENVLNLIISPPEKALICTVMAARYPGQRRTLLKMARKMNYNYFPPSYFLAAVIDTLEKNR